MENRQGNSNFTKLSLTISTLFLLVTVPVANAQVENFFGGPFADGRDHYFVSIESTEGHFLYLNHFMHFTMFNQYNARTDIVAHERARHDYQSWVDLYWYGTSSANYDNPAALADATCMAALAGNRCDRFRVRFNEDLIFSRTHEQNWHTMCHEVAHTIGSDDGATDSIGCFPQSSFSTGGFLTDAEITLINNRY